MNIYKHKINKQLYTIEHLVLDIRHLDRNASSGIYANPYKHNGDRIIFINKNHGMCTNYVDQEFEIVARR